MWQVADRVMRTVMQSYTVRLPLTGLYRTSDCPATFDRICSSHSELVGSKLSTDFQIALE